MKSKTKSLSRIKWFCGTVIVTVLASIILPSLLPFFESKVCARSPAYSSSAKVLLISINRFQRSYYVEHGHFMSSIEQATRESIGDYREKDLEDHWETSIQIKDDVAFAYAVAKDANQNLYSYVAATTAYPTTDDGRNNIICRTIEPSTAQPAAPMLQQSQQFIFWRQDAKLVCSSGTEDC